MIKRILIATSAFVLLSVIVIGAVSATPSRQQSELSPFDLLVAVLNDASDKGTLPDALSVLLSDLLIEYLITPATGESTSQVTDRLSMAADTTPTAVNAPEPKTDFGVINIAINDVPPGVGLGSAQMSNAFHYFGVGEVTMKFVDPGVVAPMLAESWELDLVGGSPVGATLIIRDDVIFHGEGLGDRSNNGRMAKCSPEEILPSLGQRLGRRRIHHPAPWVSCESGYLPHDGRPSILDCYRTYSRHSSIF